MCMQNTDKVFVQSSDFCQIETKCLAKILEISLFCNGCLVNSVKLASFYLI